MRTEEEIRKKIDFLTKKMGKTKKRFLNGEIGYSAFTNGIAGDHNEYFIIDMGQILKRVLEEQE